MLFHRIYAKILFLSFLSLFLFSCGKNKNIWKLQGTVQNYPNKYVYISIRGQIDSVLTSEKGTFLFERENQKSEFVKLSLTPGLQPNLMLFADSICNIIVTISNTNNITNATIQNSKESEKLRDLSEWTTQQHDARNKLIQEYHNLAEKTERLDTVKIIYISKLDSLFEYNYDYIQTFVTNNIDCPSATTASFITFDTIQYIPILCQKPEGIKLFSQVSKKLQSRYGNIPFVELYAKSALNFEMKYGK